MKWRSIGLFTSCIVFWLQNCCFLFFSLFMTLPCTTWCQPLWLSVNCSQLPWLMPVMFVLFCRCPWNVVQGWGELDDAPWCLLVYGHHLFDVRDPAMEDDKRGDACSKTMLAPATYLTMLCWGYMRDNRDGSFPGSFPGVCSPDFAAIKQSTNNTCLEFC